MQTSEQHGQNPWRSVPLGSSVRVVYRYTRPQVSKAAESYRLEPPVPCYLIQNYREEMSEEATEESLLSGEGKMETSSSSLKTALRATET